MEVSKTADNGRKSTSHPLRTHQISVSESKDGAVDADSDPCGPDVNPRLLLQPETKAISHDQLVTEVRGIYAGLVMVEAKCIDMDEKQLSAALDKHSRSRLNPEQRQALTTPHKTLLHEHHDFFLASQHPSASSALSYLAAKYSMHARMWRHGIHAFLEVLRHRLSESLDYMLAFLYLAYSMMALLYETVPAFEDTWTKCLGDLAQYRMVIEDDDFGDDDWGDVARFWYEKAAEENPGVGRLHHHLAVLARQDSVLQLNLYMRAMTCTGPFDSDEGNVTMSFDPKLRGEKSPPFRSFQVETPFVKAHGLLFLRQSTTGFLQNIQQLSSGSLDFENGGTRLILRRTNRSGCSLLSASLLKKLTWALLLHPALAQSDRGGIASGYEEDRPPLGSSHTVLESWIPVIFGLACVVGSILYAWWCGRRLIVSSTMMGVMSLIWTNVYGDVRTSPQLFWTIFGLQMLYMFAYGAEQFCRFRMTTGHILLITVTTVILDYTVVSPLQSPGTGADLMRFSFPAMSFSLLFWTWIASIEHQRQLDYRQTQAHDLEIGTDRRLDHSQNQVTGLNSGIPHFPGSLSTEGRLRLSPLGHELDSQEIDGPELDGQDLASPELDGHQVASNVHNAYQLGLYRARPDMR